LLLLHRRRCKRIKLLVKLSSLFFSSTLFFTHNFLVVLSLFALEFFKKLTSLSFCFLVSVSVCLVILVASGITVVSVALLLLVASLFTPALTSVEVTTWRTSRSLLLIGLSSAKRILSHILSLFVVLFLFGWITQHTICI